MDQQFMQAVFIVGAVLVIGLPIYLIVRHKAAIKKVWADFAKAHNLTLHEGAWPAVEGMLDGRKFQMGADIARDIKGMQAVQVAQFIIRMEVRNAPAGLIAGKRGGSDGNVATGDNKLYVNCDDPVTGKGWLTPARQEALKQVVSLGAVVVGAKDGNPAWLARSQTGYKVKAAWFEEQRASFLATAKALD